MTRRTAPPDLVTLVLAGWIVWGALGWVLWIVEVSRG